MPTRRIPQARLKGRLTIAAAMAFLLTVAMARSMLARDLAPEVDSLFELGVKNTPSAVAAARSRYELLKQASPGDRRVDYAYGLVLLNQHRYPEAILLLKNPQQNGKPDIATSRARIWALIQDRKIDSAFQEIAEVSQVFREAEDLNPGDKSKDDTARFIGAMFGYLDLVRPGSVDPDLRSKYRNVILANLGDRYTPLFDAGRTDVAARLAGLQSDRKLAQQRKTASHQERLERDQATLDDDRNQIADREELMQTHLDGARDAQRALNVVKTQWESLRSDRTRLTAQIVTVQAQLSEIQNPPTVVNTPRNAPAPGDTVNMTARTTLFGPTTAEFARAAALAFSLGRLNKQAFDMDRRLLSLQQRSAELTDRGLQEADALDRHDAAVQRTAKRAKAMEKKINRQSAAPIGSTPVLTSQMSALSTYLPFPYEQERKRVLAWFEK